MDMIGEMWVTMAPTGKVIIAILGILSTYSLAVVVERTAALRWCAQRTDAFAAAAGDGRDAASLRRLAESPEYQEFASLASIVAGGLQEYDRLRDEGASDDTVVDAVEDARTHGLDVAVINLRARLTSMATVAGIAPFLGLFGTVTGLIAAFRGIAETGGGGLAAVSSGVSEALVTTVIGLFVAMPALWAYNYFMNRIDVTVVDLDNRTRSLIQGALRGQVRPTGERTKDRREKRSVGDRPKISALPDITPIVNVALVLLIIFMIVTPMIREGIQVDTPAAEAVEQLSESDQSVVLAIRADGTMYVNLKPVDQTSLVGELGLAYRGNEGKAVVIKGAQNLPYSDILAVMDVCKSIGAPGVDLVAAKVK